MPPDDVSAATNRQASVLSTAVQIAFTWNGNKQDNYDIYVKVVGSGAPLRLTTDPGTDFSPAWSPDGRTIAFMRRSGNDDKVMLLPALGGAERTLARFPLLRPFRMLAWSPDGKFVVATGRQPNGAAPLHAIAVESGDVRTLTSPPSGNDDVTPAFSPDGRSLAFSRWSGMNLAQLFVVPVSPSLEVQGEPRQLRLDTTLAEQPAWTADGRELLYSAGLDLRSNIYRVRADGSAPPRLIEAFGDGVSHPMISAAGHRLVYERNGRTSNIWRLDLKDPSAAPVAIVSSTSRDAAPQYSPDGSRIVFYSNRSGLNQIWICDADGTRPAQLTSMTGNITGSPRWSPDGKQIVFDSNSGGDWHLYVMDAEGGKPRVVTTAKGGNFIGIWSRDGRAIYYGHGTDSGESVWKVPVSGGAAEQVAPAGTMTAMESEDGKSLFVVKQGVANQTSLWRMPIGGGEPNALVPVMFRYSFAVVKNGVYYAKPSQNGPATIEYLDFSTGKVGKLYTLTKPVDLGLAVSPDGRYLLFAQQDFSGSDLMLVEGFR